VSEFVSSIVEEAEARANEIIAEAQEQAGEQREASSAGLGRIHEKVEVLAGELSALLGELRRESESLSGEPGLQAALPPPMTPAGEHDAVEPEDAHFVEAVVVEEGEVEVEEEGEVVDAEVEHAPAGMVPADQNGTAGAAEEPEDPRVRVSRMTDEELARTYTNAVRAAQRTEGDDDYAERLRDLAEAAVEDALRRPAFADGAPEPKGGLFRRSSARRRRRRAVLLAELREACRQAREHQVAAGSPGF
jgi:hypothetical protein